MPKKYSVIYEQLVSDKNDVLGLIAYGIYKSAKIEYIKEFTDANDGVPPTDEELETFHDACRHNLESYKSEATAILHEYSEEYLSGQLEELEEKVSAAYEEEVANLKPSFWFGSLQSFIGSVGFAVFVGIILFILLWMQRGFWATVKELAEPIERPRIEETIDQGQAGREDQPGEAGEEDKKDRPN